VAHSFPLDCTRQARNQLATIHLKYRGGRVAFAEHQISKALRQNPTGGTVVSQNLLSITVHPLRALYEFDGARVTIVQFRDSLEDLNP